MMNKKILQVALSQFGIKEFKGYKTNKEIIKYFNQTGFKWVRSDETAWCSAFLNWVIKQVGLTGSKQLTARSWLGVGNKVTQPKQGDIVVFWRESPQSWKGHVGIYIRQTKNFVYVLGGNQQNSVKISAYPKERLIAYRRL